MSLAMAVLNRRPSMSARHAGDGAVQQPQRLVVGRACRRPGARRSPRRPGSARPAAGSGTCRRRRGCSTGATASRGPIDISYSRNVSAPYASYMSSGVTTFFRLLPIFPNSRLTGSPLHCRRRRPRRDLVGGHDMPRRVGVGVGLDVALVEQPVERLLRGHVAEVVQHLVPEAGVEQVQHGVLDAADVEVDAAGVARRLRAHPVALDLGVDEAVLVGGVEVAQLVPARTGPLRHHVQLAPVAASGRRPGRARRPASRRRGPAAAPARTSRRRGRGVRA